ncbi:four helix bundle protein [Mucilaginibacter pallidiroseus]|uniref:Four helix bundle protein n=1 Tax=Mucilaginibacter pallidiroseus TaxID=2599295 RepID=A0A563UDK3_9SPHI|nr:four helix bundle protein [Mucilaginibacter pallidiroseus]TWR29396.1 four helix bundle protein [Mucilaginibacter pallidiroseus]
MAFKFENLQVWQRALDLSEQVDLLTKNSFPKEELFILTSQIKRAADSVVLNIAEGCTGQSNATFKQFLGYALRSAVEVVSCLFVGQRRRIINETDFKRLYIDYEALCKMISALRNTL